MSEFEGEERKGKDIVADLNVKLKAAVIRAVDIVHERDGLLACMQQSQRGHDKVVKSITRVQSTISRLCAGLKENRNIWIVGRI